MNESQARLVDSLCKIMATIALVVGGGWTLYTYFNARADEARTAAIEARKPFLAKRLEVYFQLVEITSKITDHSGDLKMNPEKSNPDEHGVWRVSPQLVQDGMDLNMLRYGRLALVEEKSVEDALTEFDHCMFDNKCSYKMLRQRSQSIAHACRDSIGSSWEVSLSHSTVKADSNNATN